MKLDGVGHGDGVAASPPMRGRGLKQQPEATVGEAVVAPHAGAWIETGQPPDGSHSLWSPPMRGRGLKHEYRSERRRPHGRPPCGGVD